MRPPVVATTSWRGPRPARRPRCRRVSFTWGRARSALRIDAAGGGFDTERVAVGWSGINPADTYADLDVYSDRHTDGHADGYTDRNPHHHVNAYDDEYRYRNLHTQQHAHRNRHLHT